jgi:hypothetical protein
LRKLKAKEPIKYEQIRQDLWKKPLVVLPFGNTKSVVEYLGRYTHKIAISNHRIRSIDTQNVTLIIRIIGGRTEANDTHTRRVYQKVFLHILPKRFVKNSSLWF